MATAMGRLQSLNNFTFITDIDINRTNALDTLTSLLKTGKRYLIARHMDFPGFYYNDHVAYINLLREPGTREQSLYYYMRDLSDTVLTESDGAKEKKHKEKVKQIKLNVIATYGNLSLGECLNYDDWKNCFPLDEEHSQAAQLLGYRNIQKTPSIDLLSHFMEDISVGITEEFLETAKRWELELPSFFQNLTESLLATKREKTGSYVQSSDQDLRKCGDRYPLDRVVYEFARKQLHEYLHICTRKFIMPTPM
ncbi:hypothetical protein M9434_004895 [Picochlorum sp. BPE23]|nr:hypothetical protein M9434_004895 [Picochlorum sp. BPE23]